MQVQLKAWGNSQGIRFPKEFLKAAGFNSDDVLHAEARDGKIIQSRFVRPKQRPYMTDNFYSAIQKQIDINKEARFIAEKHPNPTPP